MSPPDPGADPVLLERIPLEQDGTSAALLTLNRPDQLNALDREMIARLGARLDEVEAATDVRAVLVTGAGRAFSAGGDLKKYIELQADPVAFPAFVAELHETFGRLGRLAVPVIALVNGVTAAGGLELLLNTDVVLAARSAKIGDGHLNFGQMGGGGVLTLLPRMVGILRASELLYSGRFLAAGEAADWGLVNQVVADEDLHRSGLALCTSIARKSPAAVGNAKYVLRSVWAEGGSVDAGLRLERERNAYYCLLSDDAREGLAAFAEKREPRFGGR